MPIFQTALSLFPSYLSSFFPPNVGATRFSNSSLYGDFLSNAGTAGLALPYRFLVFFECGSWLDQRIALMPFMSEKLTLKAFSTNVPSKYFSTLERDIGGPKRRLPYTTTFDEELTVQFYCSNNLMEYGFFQRWMDNIIDPVTRYVSFYDDFAKDTNVTLILVPNGYKFNVSSSGAALNIGDITEDMKNGKLRGVRFTEVYPRSMNINGGTLEWAGNTKPMFVNVNFAFREAVDVTTYDDYMDNAIRQLQSVDASLRGEAMMDEWSKTHPEEQIAMDGLAQALRGNNANIMGEAEQDAKAFGNLNMPEANAQVADQGRVINFNPPPATPGSFAT